VNSALRKYLESGMTLANAAVHAGLTYEDARRQLSQATDDADLEAQRLALGAHSKAALDTLLGLLSDEDAKVQLGAAKAILDAQLKHKPKRMQVQEDNAGEDLWTMAAKRRSVDTNGPEPRVLEDVDGPASEQGGIEPSARADDNPAPTRPHDVAEDRKLGDLDMPAWPFDLDSEDLPHGTHDQDKVWPGAHAAGVEPGRSVSHVLHDSAALCAQKHDSTLFEEPPAVS
jgi:hypothetical protein